MERLEQMLTTLDIAEMMGMSHKSILRKLEGREVSGKRTDGVIDILRRHQMVPSDYFIKSTYFNNQNKEMPCYEVTRKGCELLAHKFQGEKGVLFTIKYIERFHQMEQALKQAPPPEPERIRLLPDFTGRHAEEKRIAAEFIQDFLVENNDDTGIYKAYQLWSMGQYGYFLPYSIFWEVRRSVNQLRLGTGSWRPYVNSTRMITGK